MTAPGLAADPGAGNVEGIRDLAAFFRARATSERDRGTSSQRALRALSPVTALSVDALRPRITTLAGRFTSVAEAADAAAGVLDGYADAVADLRRRAAAAREQAESDFAAIGTRREAALNAASELVVGWALDWDDVLPSWLYLDDRSYLDRWQGAIDDFRASRSAYNALREERDRLDHETAASLRAIPLIAEITHEGAVSAGGFVAATALWAGDTDEVTAQQMAALADPELIRQVWDSLDRAQKDALIAAEPRVIGNLDGIPIGDRVEANRVNIQEEIAAGEAEIARLQDVRDAALERTYHSRRAVEQAYDDLIAEQQRLIDYYEGLLSQEIQVADESGTVHTETGARVVVFDPSRQAIATYHGPIDPATGDIPSWVRSVAISVPGTGSNITDFGDDHAADLQAAAGPSSAVFQWAGGPFPQWIPEAMDAWYSHDLAPRLRDFAAGIAVPAAATLTVVGHSYGGATVGLAEAAGLRADRILYIAAAGMGDGVSGLDDFPYTSDVPHYAMMSRNDMVVGLIQGREGELHALHGQSSLTAEGVTRLETGVIDASQPDSTNIEDYNVPGNGMPSQIDSHSSLYTPGSTAFENMVAVITGGRAELYAEDEILTGGGYPVIISGIDRDDYTPAYTEVD
ncbi:alpha/beta hydrolase [Microbacterium timonense]|uniref:alpha/beta hydrolase n=1 Tax=Microbacterium timonense TaxID=2086576 RepID=UPI000D0FB931|nr:alpha/beta hydrolase [Microbacterium timonense]